MGPVGEFDYYNDVKLWLEREKGYYVGRKERWRGYEDTGTLEFRVDVLGVKGIDTSNVEIAAVEVKSNRIEEKDIKQAARYLEFAHRCYLASPEEAGNEVLSKIKKRGIGLLRIYKTTKRIQEIIEPTKSEPEEAKMLEWLDRLKIWKCKFCGSYVQKDRIEQFLIEETPLMVKCIDCP